MADADDVRRLALSLPHVEEIDSDGFDFRVGGKGFVWSYPERSRAAPGHQDRYRGAVRRRRGREAGPAARRAAAVLHRARLRRLAAGNAAAGGG